MKTSYQSPIASIMVYVPDWQEGLRWYGRAFPDAELSTVSNGFAYLNYQGVSGVILDQKHGRIDWGH